MSTFLLSANLNTVFAADDYWALWALVIGWATISIVLEQKYQWASKLSGAIIALIGGLLLANFKIIPTESPVYDIVWSYVVPISIPMLLFEANMKRIVKESGRMFIAFWFSAAGTCVGAILATFLLKSHIPELYKVAAMMTGSYIGGGVNMVAMAAAFEPSESIFNSTVVADNLVMAVYFLALIQISAMSFFRKRFKLSYPDLDGSVAVDSEADTKASEYWQRKEISLKDIALTIAIAFGIAAISTKLGGFIGTQFVLSEGSGRFTEMIHTIVTNQFLIITILTVGLVTGFPKFFENLSGGQEIGTFLIYLFLMVIGIPASIMEIIRNSPLLFVFCFIIVVMNILFSLLSSKLTKVTLEEAMLSANATVGGPTTAAAMAISKGWTNHIVPALLTGIMGYVFGNVFGIVIGSFLKGF